MFSYRTLLIVEMLCASLFAVSLSAEEIQPIPLGKFPLLFVDDVGVADRANLSRTAHPAKTLPQPVIDSDRPDDRVYVYGTVHVDPATGTLHLWYMDVPHPGAGGTNTRHAVSKDGVNWTPRAQSDVVGTLSSASLVVDPFETDPARRYKMLGGKREYYTSFSADGVHWSEVDKRKSIGHGGDTLTLAQDPHTGEFLLYNKHEKTVRGQNRRVVGLMRSRNFVTWTNEGNVLVPDEADDAWATQADESTQIYSMSVYPHAAGYVGLSMMFHITGIGARGSRRSGQNGPIEVQLSSSADGKAWERFEPRVSMIPLGAPGTYSGGGVLGVSNTVANVGDKTWVYYTAMSTGHGGAIPTKRMTIARAEWRRDGFVSFDADPMGGRLQTKPLRLTTNKLLVNADASRGELRAALVEADGRPIPGFALADAEPLTADATRWSPKWQGGTPPGDRAVCVVIEMRSSRLYSLAGE